MILRHVNRSRDMSYSEVRNSRSLNFHIYFFLTNIFFFRLAHYLIESELISNRFICLREVQVQTF